MDNKRILVVDNCCCFVGLKTGSLIIGYLNLIASIVVPVLVLILFKSVIGDLGIQINMRHENQIIVLHLFLVLACFFVFLCFNIVFLIGVHQNKSSYVRAYFVFAVFVLVFNCVTYIRTIVEKLGSEQHRVSQPLNIMYQLYSLLIIRSYFLKMAEPEKGPPILEKA